MSANLPGLGYADPSYSIAASPPANVDGIVAVGALERAIQVEKPLRVAGFLSEYMRTWNSDLVTG